MINMLKTKIGELRLRNPTILASGILGTNAGLLKRVSDAGAGAVTTKSISLKPQEGYENPTVVELECGLLNAMGLPNPGIDEFKKEMEKFEKDKEIPLIASCFGTPDEFPLLASRLDALRGVDAIELDISCPHHGVGEISQDAELVKSLVEDIKPVIKKPLIVKLSPNVTSISEIALSAADAGADILSAINTVRGMAINIETAEPVLYNKVGGYSGPGIKPIALRCVYEVFSTLKNAGMDVPIIGIGGIICGRDAAEMIMAGASAVGIGTGIMHREIEIFQSVCDEMEEFMLKEGYSNIEEIVGLGVK